MDMSSELTPSERVVIVNTLPAARREAAVADVLPPYDLKRAMRHLRLRLGLVVTCIAIGSLVAMAISIIHKPNYTAAALLSVNQQGDDGRNGDASVDTQIAMLQSPVFVERAFNALSRDKAIGKTLSGPEDLERRLKVSQVMRSRLVSINFSAKSPETAAEIANRIAHLYVESPHMQGVQSIDDASETLSGRIAALEAQLAKVEADRQKEQAASSPATASGRASDLREEIATLKLSQSLARRSEETRQQNLALSPPIQLIALATPPARPSSLKPIFIIIPAIIFSTIFGLALALFLGSLDKRIYLPSELAETLQLSSVGVPVRRRRFGARPGRLSGHTVGYLRAIETVVTSALLLQKKPRSTLLLTASEDNDQAFDFALNFASAAAQLRRTLLIDMDPTRAQKHSFGPRDPARARGIFDILAGLCLAREAIQTIPKTRLDYIAAGHDYGPDALLLVAGDRLKQLLGELRPSYDWIMILWVPHRRRERDAACRRDGRTGHARHKSRRIDVTRCRGGVARAVMLDGARYLFRRLRPDLLSSDGRAKTLPPRELP